MYEYLQAYAVFEYREMDTRHPLLLMRRLVGTGVLRFIGPDYAGVCMLCHIF